MKKIGFITLLVILGVSFTALTYAQEKTSKDSKTTKTEVKAEKVQKDEVVSVTKGKPVNSVCPVSGEELDEDQQLVKYKGEIIAVCCKKCEKKIKADPEKYLKKLKRDKEADSK
jgi:predicted subunit of tRNA(5-methylaminomethyl-2-thiouridylate) methyltransferase